MIGRLKAFWGVLNTTQHPLRTVWAQLLLKSGLHKYFSIPMDGYRLKFSRSALAVTLFSNPGDRQTDEAFLKKILRPGDTYVDVGANIGTLVLAAAKQVGAEGVVVAIEAHPRTFSYLEDNVQLNGFGNTRLIHTAVGNKPGSIYFSNINSDDQNKVIDKSSHAIEVNMDTLDNLLNAYDVIHVLKIDVEGYEKNVLEGARDTLGKTRIIFFESWERHFNGFDYTTTDITNLLSSAGFSIFKPVDNNLLPLDTGYKSITCENLVAMKDTQGFCTSYGFNLRSPIQ